MAISNSSLTLMSGFGFIANKADLSGQTYPLVLYGAQMSQLRW